MPRSRRRTRRRRKLIGVAAGVLLLGGLAWMVWQWLATPDVAQYFTAAETARNSGNLAVAVIDYKNVLQLQPRHLEARWRLGQTYLGLHQAASALSELKEAASLAGQHPEIHLDTARALLEVGKYQDALTDLALYRGPLNADRVALEAQAKMGLGQKDAAKAALKTAVQESPDAASLQLATARMALSEQDLPGAAAALGAALKITPKDPEALLLSGRVALAQHRYSDAEGAFRLSYQTASSKTQAGAGLAESLLIENKFDEAKVVIDELAKAGPGVVGVQYLQGWLEYAQEHWAGAETILRGVVQMMPKHPQALLMAADSCFRQKKYDLAESLLKTFDEFYPGQPPAHKLLGAIYLKQHRAADAIKTLASFADAEPPDPGILGLLSYAYYLSGDNAQGAVLLQKAQLLAPDSPSLQAQQAIGEIASGDAAAGIASLEKLAAAAPTSVQPRQLLTFAHLLKGDGQAAIDTATELTRINPDPMAHNLLGIAYARQGDKPHAREAFNAALNRDPKFAPALANLGFLALSDGQEQAGKAKLEAAWAVDKSYTAAALGLAALAERAGKPEETKRRLEEAVAAQPRASAPRWLLAERLLNSGQREEAITLARSAFELAPTTRASRLQMGTFQLRANLPEDAYKTFAALQAEIKETSPVTYWLAEASRATRRFDEARQHYHALELANPATMEVLWGLFATELATKTFDAADAMIGKIDAVDKAIGARARGELAFARGDLPAAIQAFRDALTLNSNTSTFLQYVNALRRQGDAPEIRKAYAEWLTQHPEDVASRLHLGEFELGQKDYKAAQAAFEKILQAAPEQPVALNNLAWLYDVDGDDRALAIAEKARQLLPNLPESADTLGWILVRQDQLHRGLKLLEEARTALPTEPNIAYHYAYALNKAGDKARAEEILSEVLGTEQKFDAINDARALLRRLTKQPDEIDRLKF